VSDVTFQVTWDAQSEAMLNRFLTTGQAMQSLFDDLSESYGEAGKAFIKDAVRGNGYWQASNFALNHLSYTCHRPRGECLLCHT
jgi:hypothetical protein